MGEFERNSMGSESRPDTAKDIADQAVKDARLAEDQIVAGQLQGITGGMLRDNVEATLEARGQGAVGQAEEKKREDDFHFQLRANEILEELQARIAELDTQIAELREREARLREEAQENFEQADDLEDIAEALESGKQLTPEQQRILQGFQKKNPGKDGDDLIMALRADAIHQRRIAQEQVDTADAAAQKIKELEEEQKVLDSCQAELQNQVDNGAPDPDTVSRIKAMVDNKEETVTEARAQIAAQTIDIYGL